MTVFLNLLTTNGDTGHRTCVFIITCVTYIPNLRKMDKSRGHCHGRTVLRTHAHT